MRPLHLFCSNLLTRSSSIAYWLTVSRPVDPVHCNPSSARIRGSGKNPQCPNVRFASWLYLYRALDFNYFDEMHEVTKVFRVQPCFEEKCLRHLLFSPSGPAAYSISICDHWTPTLRMHNAYSVPERWMTINTSTALLHCIALRQCTP